ARVHQGPGRGERPDRDGRAGPGKNPVGHRKRDHGLRPVGAAHRRARGAGGQGGAADGACGVRKAAKPGGTTPGLRRTQGRGRPRGGELRGALRGVRRNGEHATAGGPRALPVLAENIPLALRDVAHWVVWKYVQEIDPDTHEVDWDKPPLSAK